MEIKLEDFSKSYKTKKIFTPQNCEFQVNNITLLLGESGVGKTTLCNCIYGIDKDYKGNIILKDKQDVKITFMPQSNKLLDYMTVEENILSYAEVGYETKVDQLLESLEIGELKSKKVNELSGGQKQRVNLARSLINKPDLCILDEPTGSLDDATANSIIVLLKQINEKYNTKFLIITHDIRLVKEFVDYIRIERQNIDVQTEKKIHAISEVKKVDKNFDGNILFKNSRKQNKKPLLFSGFVMVFFSLLFCLLTLFLISSGNEFINTVDSFWGENGGRIVNTHTVDKDIGTCEYLGEYEVCDIYGILQIPEYIFFTQEELEYISSYEGIEQITYVYDVRSEGNIQITYNATKIATIPMQQAEAYQEATGDMILADTDAMQFAQLIAPVEELKNYGTMAVSSAFWEVKYGEVHELEQNEIVLPYSYAKVVAYELGVEVEELVGMTLTFEDYNTTSIEVVDGQIEFMKEYSTIDYTVAWIYEDVDNAYIYIPYVEDQSLYTTDIDAMFGELFFFLEGNDEALEYMMNDIYVRMVENYEGLLESPNTTESDLAYAKYFVDVNSDLENKEASLQTGVRQIFYTLKPGYTQQEFMEYLLVGPMPLSTRTIENTEVLLADEAYNHNDERFVKIIIVSFILMIVLFFLQKLYFKDIYKELQLAKLLGFSKKVRFHILLKFFVLLLITTLIIILPISIFIMLIINIFITPIYLSFLSFIVVGIVISVLSLFSFLLNYYLVLSQDPKKELHD